MPKGDKFEVGDLVFAKVKGYPPWPARITGLGSKEKYKIYFYGTYETASLKSEDIWIYNKENEETFGPKYIKKKGYREGLYEIANSPDICLVEDGGGGGDVSKADISLETSNISLNNSAMKLSSPPKSVLKSQKKPTTVEVFESPKVNSQQQRSGVKRKATEGGDSEAEQQPEAKRPSLDEAVKKLGQTGRRTKPSGDEGVTPVQQESLDSVSHTTEVEAVVSPKKSSEAPVKKDSVIDLGEGRRLWVKVKDTDDLIEINLDKDKPESFQSEQARVEWEMASARKALKFKKRVESGDFIPPEILKKLEERSKKSPAELAALQKERKLEKSRQKLRWLKIEQRLVELDIAVKTSLNLERPSPDRCVAALEELRELNVMPLMLKKQPDIVTTVKKLRIYVGPKNFRSWPDEDARNRMERSVGNIQRLSEEIYLKFRKCFARVGQTEENFYETFLKEAEEFRSFTKDWDERKVLSMIRDPTRVISSLNPISDEEEED